MTVTTTRTALAAMPGNEDRLAVTAPAPAASPRVGASLVASALVTATTTRAALAAMRPLIGISGEPLFTRACGLGLEGVISKRRDAAYHSGRHRDWLKVKCGRRQEVVVGGFTAARSGGRAIGALLVGVYDDTGGFHYGGDRKSVV